MADLERRFWSNVDKGTDCWVWMGHTSGGYGRIGDGPRSSHRTHYAHRLSWEMRNGPIPAGLHVLHRCDNPPCVRPEHLFLGTAADNMADMVSKGRHGLKGGKGHPARGESVYGAKLTESEVLEMRQLHGLGWKRSRIAELYGVTEVQVQNVITRRSWRHVA